MKYVALYVEPELQASRWESDDFILQYFGGVFISSE